MSLEQIIFYVFGGLVILSALAILLTKNILYAALALVFAFLGVAAIYVYASADFLAVTQIMVYVGGILVLILFGVMLSKRTTLDKNILTANRKGLGGFIVGGGLLAVLIWSITKAGLGAIVQSRQIFNAETSTEHIGVKLMTEYLLPFEIAAIVLLVALIGAATIAAKKSEGEAV